MVPTLVGCWEDGGDEKAEKKESNEGGASRLHPGCVSEPAAPSGAGLYLTRSAGVPSSQPLL